MASSLCLAQLPNGGFETWNSQTVNQPNGWFNSAGEAIKKGMAAPNVTQYTPAHGGNYAIKIETEADATDTAFGFISNAADPFSGIGGAPYTMLPDSFFCYAKVGLQTGDSALIIIIYKKSGSQIGMDMFHIGGNAPTTWQKFGFKLSTLLMTPDTVIIAAVSSNAMTGVGVQPGSFIILDDISFNTSMPIPDNGFEGWTPYVVDNPVGGWNTSGNISYALAGFGAPVQKTTDSYEGSYALWMKTINDGNGYQTGINNGNWNGDIQQYTGGFSYTLKKDTLIGWYKYTPKNIDSAGIFINFFHNHHTQIGYNYNAFLAPASTWTEFQIPFNISDFPDTAVITINSSNWPFTLQDTGSVLIIDAIQFKSDPLVGIKPFRAGTNVMIGPNPTNGEFSIFYIPKNSSNVYYTIYDEAGRVVKSAMMNNLKTTINLSDYPKGVYFVKINDGSSELNKKLILQ